MKTAYLYIVLTVNIAISCSLAATVSISQSAPEVNGADIANLDVNAIVPDAKDLLNGDRQYAGTTFTTGPNPGGYILNAITFYQSRSTPDTGGQYKIRLGTLNDKNEFVQLFTDETKNRADEFHTLSGDGTDWIQITFPPQKLTADTEYAIDIGRSSDGNYLEWAGTADTEYPNGTSYITAFRFNAGSEGQDQTVSFVSPGAPDKRFDRIFHLDIDEDTGGTQSSAQTGGGDTTGLSNWLSAYSGLDGKTGFNDDPDGDNIVNAIEYLFGTHPGEQSTGMTAGKAEGDKITFTHPINNDPIPGIRARYRWSKDGSNFHSSGETFDGTTVTLSQNSRKDGMVEVVATVSGDDPEMLFVDIEVVKN